MSLKITASKLLSRAIRSNTVSGKSGKELLSGGSSGSIRKIDLGGKLRKGRSDGGFLAWAWNSTVGFVGWAFQGLLTGLSWTISATWGLIVGTVEKLKSFNWNATEAELENAIKSRNDQLAGIWGGVIGSGVGWLAGIGVGAGVALICPTIGGASLARLVATSAADEAIEDLRARLTSALSQTVSLVANSLSVNFFLNYRSWLREAPDDLLNAVYGRDTAEWIKRYWGREGQPEISFNKSMDDFVEGLPGGPAVRNFVENFLEESWDSFVEAGFVIAHQLDEAYQQSKLAAQKGVLGSDANVEIVLDKNAPDSTIAFSAVPEKLLPTMIQQVVNTHRLIHKQDIGQWVGEPFSEGLQAMQPQKRKLTIFLRESERPPYKQLGDDGKAVQVSIPDVKLNTTWREVKDACASYTWGKCYASGTFKNRRKIQVWGATEEEAKRQLLKFAALSDSDIISVNTGKEEIKDARLVKKSIKIYPYYCTLLFRLEKAEGKTLIDSKTFTEKVVKVPLWQTQPQAGKSRLEDWLE